MNHGKKRKTKKDNELWKFVVTVTANATGTLLAEVLVKIFREILK